MSTVSIKCWNFRTSGLSFTAKWYVEDFSERSGIPVNLIVPNELKRLPDALEIALFCILEESLINIHRHGHSQSVDIQLELEFVTLKVKDYGQGISSDLLERFTSDLGGGGVGLRSMRQRFSELGGKFEIQSDKNGTQIKVTAPLADSAKKPAVADSKLPGSQPRFWPRGFCVVNTNVGGKLIVALRFVLPLHFIK
jgi:signal transduction histidine kinase